MPEQSDILNVLKTVKYPGYSRDIVSFGLVKEIQVDGNAVGVLIELTTPNPAVGEQIADAARLALRDQIPELKDAHVQVRVPPAPAAGTPGAGGSLPRSKLPGIGRIIAVASGKGGVGKSTVATNLALALQRWGAKVGLLDADVFGPSVPQMLGEPTQPAGGTPEKRIGPAVYFGMKVMSVAFFIEKNDAVVWRGPMVHKLLQQFVEDVDWGELDYLVVDLPPGTGDVQLSLSQLVPIHGAVMVTTPQEVAIIDVVKGVSMFKKVEIPLLGVVENMSYYVCPACGHHDEIFSRGGGRKLAESIGAPFLGEIPLDAKVRFGGDTGLPVVIGVPESEHARIFMELAARVAGRLVAHVLSGPRRVASLVTIR